MVRAIVSAVSAIAAARHGRRRERRAARAPLRRRGIWPRAARPHRRCGASHRRRRRARHVRLPSTGQLAAHVRDRLTTLGRRPLERGQQLQLDSAQQFVRSAANARMIALTARSRSTETACTRFRCRLNSSRTIRRSFGTSAEMPSAVDAMRCAAVALTCKSPCIDATLSGTACRSASDRLLREPVAAARPGRCRPAVRG